MKATIGEKIMNFLKKQKTPVTTMMVAEALRISWQTAKIHLLELYAEGRIQFGKIGKQNQWWIKGKI